MYFLLCNCFLDQADNYDDTIVSRGTFCLQIIIDIISSSQLMNLLRNSELGLPLLDRTAFKVVTRSLILPLFLKTNFKEPIGIYITILLGEDSSNMLKKLCYHKIHLSKL